MRTFIFLAQIKNLCASSLLGRTAPHSTAHLSPFARALPGLSRISFSWCGRGPSFNGRRHFVEPIASVTGVCQGWGLPGIYSGAS